MRLSTGMLVASATAALVAGCAPQPKTELATATPSYVDKPGAVQQCVMITNIQESKVISDNVIDFYMRDGRVFRNTLPYTCGGLMTNKSFGYETSINQLCNVNTITVIFTGGGPRRGATCGLGNFVLVQPSPTAQAAPQTPTP